MNNNPTPARHSRWVLIPAVLLFCNGLTGCGLLHELQPHRLNRWNYNDRPRSQDAFYSVPDHVPARDSESPHDGR
ncbi:MAG: hypothetical protein ACPGXX_13035 [Planctomycetaceae bacterium]